MTFTERIEKLLGANHLKEVIDEFLKFLNEVPQSNRDARNDANQLRGQIIVLSGRFTELNTKLNTNTIDSGAANQEKSVLINSFIQILNQLPSNYPDLHTYLEEKNEDDEWKESQKKNTIEGYQFYFNKYPNGKYKADTIKLIAELEEVKLKQDNEIKRLAQLEKERRENDKIFAEPQKKNQQKPAPQKIYKTAAPVNPALPAKSKKGLYIALGAVLGIVFIIIVAVSTTNTEPAQPKDEKSMSVGLTENPVAISETVKAELISAIRLADNAEIDANYSLSPEVLYKSYTGEALKTELSNIEQLKKSGFNLSSTLEQQEFKSFNLSADGLEAEVQLIETWSVIYFTTSTNACYGKVPSHTAPQTMYLKKTENGWLVSSIVQDKLSAPNLVPCNPVNQ